MYYKYCPMCGKELAVVKMHNTDTNYYVCRDIACRTQIKFDKISIIDIDKFANLQPRFNDSNNNDGAFMLLKEDLSAPLLQKNSNNILVRDRNKYCIIRAKDKEDAIRQFKEMFDVIRIDSEMVVPIDIHEKWC